MHRQTSGVLRNAMFVQWQQHKTSLNHNDQFVLIDDDLKSPLCQQISTTTTCSSNTNPTQQINSSHIIWPKGMISMLANCVCEKCVSPRQMKTPQLLDQNELYCLCAVWKHEMVKCFRVVTGREAGKWEPHRCYCTQRKAAKAQGQYRTERPTVESNTEHCY